MSTVRAKLADDGRKVGVLTRDDIIEALQEYGCLYGPNFPQSAFSPGSAKRNGRPELVEIYYKGRPNGRRWPSLNAIKSKFDGSWNDARKAAGFEPNSTGPARGRRKPGEADPILHVRERLVYVPDVKTKELRIRTNRLEERLAEVLASRERLREQIRELKARPAARTPEARVRSPKPEVRTVTKTKTKTIRVRDGRSLKRLRSKVADEQAARRATEDQLKSEQRERHRVEQAVESVRSDAAEARREAREAIGERSRALDRLAALEAHVAHLSSELDQAREQALGATEAAVVSDLVKRAEARAEAAEVRTAKAERVAAEHVAAITGELRRLTSDELDELRRKGPEGPAVMARALRKLASARSGRGNLRAALTEVARAAIGWRDRLDVEQ